MSKKSRKILKKLNKTLGKLATILEENLQEISDNTYNYCFPRTYPDPQTSTTTGGCYPTPNIPDLGSPDLGSFKRYYPSADAGEPRSCCAGDGENCTGNSDESTSN